MGGAYAIMKEMRVFLRKIVRSGKFWLGLVILVQTVVYLLAGASKAYIHMDEAYSLGLAQYERINIQDRPDFYNTWHTSEYYQDYLAVQEKDRGDLEPVYENQKNDVHPPLYYLFLRGVMEVAPGEFSKWPGIILNIALAAGNTVVMYLVIKRLTGWKTEWKIGVVLATLGLTNATISGVVYIRMYMMLTLMVTVTLWLHLKLYEEKRLRVGMLAVIGVVALLGVLTQYYYVFFLAPVYVVMMVKYGREKRWREAGWYTGVLVLAGVASLIIWPHMLEHMFFGYRGQGAMASLLNVPKLLGQIWQYVLVMDYYVFHRTLVLWAIAVIVLMVFYKPRLKQWCVVLWPTAGYFLIVAAISPFIELRYILPVCELIGLMVFVVVWNWAGKIWNERMANVVMGVSMGVMLAMLPIQMGVGVMKIELLYLDRRPIMEVTEENPDVPILYFITTENNRFLDNILPFAVAEESYLALDMDPDVRQVEEILAGKDLKNGLQVWVGDRYDQEEVLEIVKEATGLARVEMIQRVNTCDTYYFAAE